MTVLDVLAALGVLLWIEVERAWRRVTETETETHEARVARSTAQERRVRELLGEFDVEDEREESEL